MRQFFSASWRVTSAPFPADAWLQPVRHADVVLGSSATNGAALRDPNGLLDIDSLIDMAPD